MADHSFTISLGHLRIKLIAGKVQDGQATFAVLFLQIGQLLVVVLSQSTLGGDVDHQDNPALVLIQRYIVTICILHGELVNGCGVLVISGRHVDLEKKQDMRISNRPRYIMDISYIEKIYDERASKEIEI